MSSTHPKGGGKVTVLSSGEKQFTPAASAGTSSYVTAESKRKVGITFEREFAEATPGASSSGSGGARPVLKAGKAVSSAPPQPPAQRPMTQLEKEFSERPTQDQRWLLTFPLALKQLYFGFAESTNHENTLATLLRRYPELLLTSSSDGGAPPMQVAIQRGNWGPVTQFAKACAGSQHSQRLLTRCGPDASSTYLILAVAQFAQQQQQQQEPTDSAAARTAICALATACPDLMTASDSAGRNPLHHLTLTQTASSLMPENLPALLQDLQTAAKANAQLASCLGNALVARDAAGSRPVDSGIPAVQSLALEFPAVVESEPGVNNAAASLLAALTCGDKSPQFVAALARRMGSRDHRVLLLPAVADPVVQALSWFGGAYKAEMKLALADVGLEELQPLVDRL